MTETPQDEPGGPELDADVMAVLGEAGDALAAALGPLVEKIETARSLAVRLEQEAAEGRAIVAGLLEQVRPSSWAADTEMMERAQAFLAQPDEG